MKRKLLTAFMCIVILFTYVSVALADENFVTLPTRKTYRSSDFVYHGDAMRIQNTGWGGCYTVEFDVELPAVTPRAKYYQKFNWQGVDGSGTSNFGIAHESTINANGDVWKYTCLQQVVTLQPQTVYHFWIGVDLVNKIQSWSITQGNTPVASDSNKPFEESVPQGIALVLAHDLRWGDNWVTKTSDSTGEWKNIVPQNTKIIKSTSFVMEPATVTSDDSGFSASAKVFHNVKESANSPVLILSLYDSFGSMIAVSAQRLTLDSRSEATPLEYELEAQIQTKLNSGVTARAFLLDSLDSRILLAQPTELLYTQN
ncbi:MAG: hypothetical protein IJ300_11745 [Clostridia bacterium]|nr:hypothetical protein [Clostridia bacterium]